MFLKNRNFISKIKRSKVTDCAALKAVLFPESEHLLIRALLFSFTGA